MGLFSKKEEVPTLPPLPNLPNIPKPDSRINELPTIPPNKSSEKLNQEILKSAVNDFSGEKGKVGVSESSHDIGDSSIPSISSPTNAEIPSVNVGNSQPIEQANIQEIPEKPSQSSFVNSVNKQIYPASASHSFSMQNRAEPIFVRIDKFQSAKKEFGEVKSKIRDIEHMLKKIKEVKIREDAEIQEWVKDVEGLKARLSDIDTHIFNKL